SIQSQQGQVSGALLDSQSVVPADMVIVAAGSLVNSELVQHAGIELLNGSVVVSDRMQTSISNIFAAGDVCIVPDFITKKMVRSTTWSDAMLQGLCAATSLSATPRSYQGAIGIRDSYFFGMPFYGCGQTVDSSLKVVVRKKTTDTLDVVYLDQDGRLKGFVLFGDISCLSDLKRAYMLQETIGL
ncbi:FAD-dependent oxidoreductase, partial [Candidatus Babeliales bacterium]|nr:FAD-dependent oxidoreductase [Candidatus Babeliales bacterium]